MTEVEKMRSSQLADMAAPELQVRFEHAKKLLARMRGMSTYDAGYRELLEELVPEIPETSIICPPFHCDHGDGIKLGEHVFVNANCTFLDGGYITIGAHTLVGPCVQIYTPHHPMDYLERSPHRHQSAVETAACKMYGYRLQKPPAYFHTHNYFPALQHCKSLHRNSYKAHNFYGKQACKCQIRRLPVHIQPALPR